MRPFDSPASLRSFSASLAFIVAFIVALCANVAHAKGPASADVSGVALGTISVLQMPKQGQETYALIVKGGPFPYDKDGSVFGNRERLLPQQKRGFYREYTVKTPYARNRGAKRIVCGGAKPQMPEACFYTDDHYASFRKLSVN